ncbi:MAG TPA: hypothetical protein VGA36_08680, partial [Nitriliruptorales bacterium]
MGLRIRRPTRAAAASAGRRGFVLASIIAVIGLVPALPAVGTPPDTAIVTLPVDGWQVASEADAQVAPAPAPHDGHGHDEHDDHDRTGRVQADVLTSGSAGWRTSPVLEVQDVVMVGADWGGAADVMLEVRARRDGVWGAWMALHLVDDHAPDAGSAEAEGANLTSSDPVWVGRTEALQLRRLGGSDQLHVDLHGVTVSGGDGLAFRPRAALRGAAARAAPAQPSIISRADWGADESIRDQTPSYADELRFAVV